MASRMPLGCLSSHWQVFVCNFWYSPLCQNFEAIGQLLFSERSSAMVHLPWCSAMVLCHGALPWCSAAVLCHDALTRCSATVLCQGALSRCSATVLCHGALPRCSATVLCSAMVPCHGALPWGSAMVLCHGALPAMVHIWMHRKSVVFETVAKYISGGTRTHNLRIRSPTRYPLRHRDIWDLLFADNSSNCSTYVHMNDEILLTF